MIIWPMFDFGSNVSDLSTRLGKKLRLLDQFELGIMLVHCPLNSTTGKDIPVTI